MTPFELLERLRIKGPEQAKLVQVIINEEATTMSG
jgi:hypothetical protein